MSKPLLFVIMLLLVTPAMAASETLDIFGTNASNAQSNITKSGNQSVNVSIWNPDSGIKTFTINTTNITDTHTITIHNITIGRVVELRFNSISINGYQADSTGTIVFTQIQTTGNRTYDVRPAINVGGNNVTWSRFGDIVILNGTAYGFTIVSGRTINITLLNATEVEGDGYKLRNLNVTNVTGLQAQQDAQDASSHANRSYLQTIDDMFNITFALQAINNSNVNTTLAAMSTSSHANRTWTQSLFDWLNITALPAKADATYTNTTFNGKVNKSGDTMTGALIAPWLNDTSGNAYLKNTTILNTSTVTMGRNANGTVEFKSTAAAAAANRSLDFNSSNTFTVPAGIYRVYVTLWAGGGGGGGAIFNTDRWHGGGGGGSSEVWVRKHVNVNPSEEITITIGTGGAGGAAGSVGTVGGNTTFGSYVVARYGFGGSTDPTIGGAAGAGGGRANTASARLTGGSTGGAGGAGSAAGVSGASGSPMEDLAGGTGGIASALAGGGGGGGAGFYGRGGRGGGTNGACTVGATNSGAAGGGGYAAAGCNGGSGGLIVEW